LVIVTAVRRLHPRHWDGHRLLQFLTGLALLALAFGPPAAPATPPATVKSPTAAAMPATTTTEAPVTAAGIGTATIETPVAAAGLGTVQAPVVAAGLGSVRAPVVAAAPATRDGVAPAPARAVRDGAECQHDGSPVARPAAPAADEVPLAGIAKRAHGSRAPPRHS
jgi:hypothetical protein